MLHCLPEGLSMRLQLGHSSICAATNQHQIFIFNFVSVFPAPLTRQSFPETVSRANPVDHRIMIKQPATEETDFMFRIPETRCSYIKIVAVVKTIKSSACLSKFSIGQQEHLGCEKRSKTVYFIYI